MFSEFMLLFKFFILLYGVYMVYQIKSNTSGKSNKIITESSVSTSDINDGVTRDRYSKRKVPKDIDVIVIGSGIGGLSCAAYLSKVGKKVLVLEQHYIAGGCCHVFDEKGVEHETGIHYVGNIEKRKEILDLITVEPIEWCKMGAGAGASTEVDGVYDEICIEGETYLFRAGEENFISDLSKRFEGEEAGIRKYIDLVKKVAKKDLFFNLKIIKSKWLSLLGHYYLKYYDTDYYKYTNTSAYDVIKTFTNNETLAAVLGGQFGDYGPTPKKANFFIHASIVNHYLEGGYFPKGGPGSIIKNIIPTIEASGGRVFVNAKVDTFLVNSDNSSDKIVGVQLANGDKIYAKQVVSAVGLNNTFNRLIPDELLENDSVNKYKKMIEKIGSSTGFIYCFVNLDGTAEELGLRDSNIWVYPNKDYDEMLETFEADIQNNPMPMFIASSSAKDSSWNERYPNKSSMILLTLAKKEWFEQWENETCMKRNLDYKDLKEHMAQRLINEGLYKFYPKTNGKITHYEVGTPLTNQFYLGCLDGEGYGLDTTNYRYSVAHELRPETPIKNLYLTGQDICTLGFTGALMGGILTAHSILGYGSLMDILSGRNLIKDLIKLEKKNT
jgi:all-trans-retinol 13,14-reductase